MSNYEISKSSLLSLKAEILRKQEELVKVKQDNRVKLANIKKISPLFVKNKGVEERQLNDVDPEEESVLQKSKKALEAKSKLYETLLQKSINTLEDDDEDSRKYLVQFNKKTMDSLPFAESNEKSDTFEDINDEVEIDNFDKYDLGVNSDNEWVEYVDCLGRTRTCLRKDLPHIKMDDANLKRDMEVKRTTNLEDPRPSNTTQIVSEEPVAETKGASETGGELVSSDMRRELLRQKWETEEEELRNKTDIHYEDVLFDEARSHGVGYYRFSKDEEERKKQQEALRNLREETSEKQKKNQDLRALREKQMATRLKAARNRKRARMGLPPEEDEVVLEKPKLPETSSEKPTETVTNVEELAREKARSRHIRPWDIGKEGIKEHYVYTQEEWVDKKRKEREPEFAPPTSYRKEFRSTVPQNNILDESIDKSLHFSSKQNQYTSYQSTEQYKEYVATPIFNECDLSEEEVINYDTFSSDLNVPCVISNEKFRSRGAEIAPPPTYEYYGPSYSKKSRTATTKDSLEDSINAGLQFLRAQFERKDKSHRDRDDMFIM